MNCTQTRDWLAQQAVEPTSPSREAEEHLQGCPECKKAQAGLQNLTIPSYDPPLGLVEKTMRKIQEQPTQEFWVDRWIGALSAWLQSRHPLTAAAMVCALFLVVLAPNWIRGRAQGALTGCQANLQTLSVALEDYADAHNRQYPQRLDDLPLQSMPSCPSADQPTYALQVSADRKSYTVYCAGNHHGEKDYPSSTKRP